MLEKWIPIQFEPDVERLYAKHMLERFIPLMRIACVAAILAFIGFQTWDLMLDPEQDFRYEFATASISFEEQRFNRQTMHPSVQIGIQAESGKPQMRGLKQDRIQSSPKLPLLLNRCI